MPPYFCVTVRFLQPTYHGRGGHGEPEWPPSPLRVFQALVAASAARWNERSRLRHAAPALRWLERQPAPTIVAPAGRAAAARYRLYVPDNVGDKVAASWSRGVAASLAGYRTEKDVHPTLLRDCFEAVHYLWPAAGPEFERSQDVLAEAARSITHLGWGVDIVAAGASVISGAAADALAGERWRPCDGPPEPGLRVPVAGTLDALVARHGAFLNRLGPEGFHPVPPLTAFRVVGYRRATDPVRRPFAAFGLLRPGAAHANDFRPFDPARRTMAVAGMLRHAAAAGEVASALGWTPEKVAGFVLGHGEPVGQPYAPVRGPRLAYLPLPSIEFRDGGRARVVTGIRRALITVLNGDGGDDLRHLARLLSGFGLIAEEDGSVVALLSQFHYSDPTVKRYTELATTWATVTPVVLPGHDDPRKIRKRLSANSEADALRLSPGERQERLRKLDRRTDHLLRKAIRQAGYPDELARSAEIDWRPVGFWRGTEPATRYAFPDKLRRFRRLHVRICWRDACGRPIRVPGPLCLGGGRYCGLGLFASTD
jgi:CRISPR-associated protein Csb2